MAQAADPDPESLPCEPLTKSDPRTIGPYETVGLLCSGAMGRVDLARRRPPWTGGSAVPALAAVKVIHAGLADDPRYRQRFAHEIAAARRVASRRTATVLDADADAEQPWVATEYVPGPSLARSVEQDGRWDSARVRGLARGVATALIAVPNAGIVHRDLKPANVVIGPEGPKVIDFGIARALDQSGLTATGHILGTPEYMAPEQAEGISPAEPATDIFALGGLLVFAATGRPPFGAGRPLEVMHRVVAGTADLDGVAEDDAELRALIEACLAKDPAGRPSAAEVLVTSSRPAAGDARDGAAWRSGSRADSDAADQHADSIGVAPTMTADVSAGASFPASGAGPGRDDRDRAASPARFTPRHISTRRETIGIAVVVVLVTCALAALSLLPGSGGSPGSHDGTNAPTSSAGLSVPRAGAGPQP